MWSNPRIPFAMSSERPSYAPLRGKPLMINPVVAIEYWPFDQPMPRGVLPPPHGAKIEPPDIANYSWVEYGLRCGMPRLFDLMGRRGIRASAFINAVFVTSSEIADWFVAADPNGPAELDAAVTARATS
jgi:allantoinase